MEVLQNDECGKEDLLDEISKETEKGLYPCNLELLKSVITECVTGLRYSENLKIHSSHCSWEGPILSCDFISVEIYLHADYERLSVALGLPACTMTQRQWIEVISTAHPPER